MLGHWYAMSLCYIIIQRVILLEISSSKAHCRESKANFKAGMCLAVIFSTFVQLCLLACNILCCACIGLMFQLPKITKSLSLDMYRLHTKGEVAQ